VNQKFKILQCAWITSLILVLCPLVTQAATTESAVKAGFIYNFTKFIEWPASTSVYATFNLCVVGDNRLDESLQALEGKNVGGKLLSLRLNVPRDSLSGCQMVFVAEDNDQTVGVLLKELSALPVVTVSDSAEFIQKGGTIGLIRDGSRVGFEVNLASANAAGVHISAQLLKLAKSLKGLK